MNPAYKLCLACDQIKTAAVSFEAFGKAYTYMFKNLELVVGQEVIVETGQDDTLKVAQVVTIHEEAEIDPNFRGTYRWILSNMGTSAREKQSQLHDLEKEVVAILRKAERSNVRKQVREQLTEAYGPDTMKLIQSISLDDPKGDPTA